MPHLSKGKKRISLFIYDFMTIYHMPEKPGVFTDANWQEMGKKLLPSLDKSGFAMIKSI